MFDGCLLVLVQVHLNQLGSVQLHADALANNLSGKDEIVEDVVVHGSQSAAARTLLFVGVWATATWLGQDLTLSAEDDVTSGEFLLQFTDQASLDLLEGLLFWDWNVDDDRLEGEKRLVGGDSGDFVDLTFLVPNSTSRARVM